MALPLPVRRLMIPLLVVFELLLLLPLAVGVVIGLVAGLADRRRRLLRITLMGMAYVVVELVALIGLAMIAFDVFTFSKSEGTLGGMRIVGHAELAGSRELIVRGLYARVRHPRYLGMMAGVFGACLIVASPLLWQASVLWLALALVTIRAEERELRARLGPAYAAYAEQVPALVPLRLRSRRKQPGSGRES